MVRLQERLRVFVDGMAMIVTMARGGRKPSWGCLRRTFFRGNERRPVWVIQLA